MSISSAAASLPVHGSWFLITDVDEGLVRIEEPCNNEIIRANSWLVRGRDRDLLIDTGAGIASLRAALSDRLDKPVIAVATHAHYDHVGSLHEFETRYAHPGDADELAGPLTLQTLVTRRLPAELAEALRKAGIQMPDFLIDALPTTGYDPRRYQVPPAPPTKLVEDGDTIDLGNRQLTVLHLPGHTPGSIALWEESSGILFSGDVIYDGPIVDEHLAGCSIPQYIDTMRRLRHIPVSAIHPGHYHSFGPEKMLQLAESYLEFRAGSASGQAR
jgi:glyoxylase-like metal-dependent hydrolase (beta-lactamase superfamily II)